MRRASTVVIALAICVPPVIGQATAEPSAPGVHERGSGGGNRYIKAKPKRVELGRKLTVQGRGFAARKQIRLKVGEPGGPLKTVEIIRSNRNGGFSERYRIRRRSEPGKGVVAACRRSCKVKEKDTFRVVRG